jgi:hypothetical protein
MLSNTKMAVEPVEVKNDNSALIRAERIYCKQRELQIRLLKINSTLVGSDITNTPELNADCVMEYLDEAEGILNYTLDLADNILQVLR